MQAKTIREQFIQFFEQKGHQQVAAAPIVNKDDPTLLFTNAGMNQFKDYFLGHKHAPHPRAVSAQPCLRVSGKHNDLEEVGADTYHHTMFEMLGNWSFGDYFKAEAIPWAWELLTAVYKLTPDRLYVTVYGGDKGDQLGVDQEAQRIWEQLIDKSHILLGSKKNNFWEMGDTGPCGPCSEVHVDIRSAAEREQVPGHTLVNRDHPRVVELWNLVFIQYNRLANGQLRALPAKHVDTGLGLERLAMVLQAKKSNYDTDLFTPLIQAISSISKHTYGQSTAIDMAIRVMADHVRAVTFAIADGQPPSNVKAGYVIRRILRRAVRYGYTYLGFEEPFMYRLVSVLVQQLQTAYAHLKSQQAYIEKLIREEEEAFLRTLATGLQRLEKLSQALPKESTVIDGSTAFELYDTHGFPIDLTVLIARERGLQVDAVGFAKALQVQRQRSRHAAAVEKGDWKKILDKPSSTFVGYDQLEANAHVVQYRMTKVQGQPRYQIVLDQTPFYPEGGGQVGDTGQLRLGKDILKVLDTRRENDLIVHEVAQLPSDLGVPLQASVDKAKRMHTASHHTATHLLHAALRQVLGLHVEQRGSLVNEKYLRFDFSHPAQLTHREIRAVEALVNEKIRANIALTEYRQMTLAEASAMGAMALFGEKYGERVRVVAFNPTFSVELCGGTHVPATGHLGFFKITASTAVAAGVRRMEAVVGAAAETLIHHQLALLQTLRGMLKQPKDLEKGIQQLLKDKASLGKQLAAYEAQQTQVVIDQLHGRFKKWNDVRYLITEVTLSNASALRQVAAALQQVTTEPGFIVITADIDQKPYIAVALTGDLENTWGRNACDIAQALAQPIQGGGGGKATLATAGGKLVQGLPRVLSLAEEMLRTTPQPV
ncbi:MAG: alanine--tRNA ligase [Bacteroidota bacterium]